MQMWQGGSKKIPGNEKKGFEVGAADEVDRDPEEEEEIDGP